MAYCLEKGVYCDRTSTSGHCAQTACTRTFQSDAAITDLLARAEATEKERDEEKSKVDEYADSARAIALWLAGFCDRSLSYPQMISNAARKIALAYADMEKRAEAAEAREKNLQEAIQMVIARADKAERERDEATALINYIYHRECAVPNEESWIKDVIARWRDEKEG